MGAQTRLLLYMRTFACLPQACMRMHFIQLMSMLMVKNNQQFWLMRPSKFPKAKWCLVYIAQCFFLDVVLKLILFPPNFPPFTPPPRLEGSKLILFLEQNLCVSNPSLFYVWFPNFTAQIYIFPCYRMQSCHQSAHCMIFFGRRKTKTVNKRWLKIILLNLGRPLGLLNAWQL